MSATLVETIAASAAVVVEIHELPRYAGFEIRTSTGYRATLPGLHTECSRIPCVKHDAFRAPSSESRTHCHGLHHLEQVRALAHKIARTYAPASPAARPRRAPAEWTSAAFAKLAERVMQTSGATAEMRPAPCGCRPHPIFGHEDACRYAGMGALPRA